MGYQIVQENHGRKVFRNGPYSRDNGGISPGDGGKLLVFERVFIYGMLLFIYGWRWFDAQTDNEWSAV